MFSINSIKQFLFISLIIVINVSIANTEEVYENFKFDSDFKQIALVNNYILRWESGICRGFCLGFPLAGGLGTSLRPMLII